MLFKYVTLPKIPKKSHTWSRSAETQGRGFECHWEALEIQRKCDAQHRLECFWLPGNSNLWWSKKSKEINPSLQVRLHSSAGHADAWRVRRNWTRGLFGSWVRPRTPTVATGPRYLILEWKWRVVWLIIQFSSLNGLGCLLPLAVSLNLSLVCKVRYALNLRWQRIGALTKGKKNKKLRKTETNETGQMDEESDGLAALN